MCFVCCLCEGPKFREGFPGQLNDSGSRTGYGENPPACILVVYSGRGVNSWSTQQWWVYFRTD